MPGIINRRKFFRLIGSELNDNNININNDLRIAYHLIRDKIMGVRLPDLLYSAYDLNDSFKSYLSVNDKKNLRLVCTKFDTIIEIEYLLMQLCEEAVTQENIEDLFLTVRLTAPSTKYKLMIKNMKKRQYWDGIFALYKVVYTDKYSMFTLSYYMDHNFYIHDKTYILLKHQLTPYTLQYFASTARRSEFIQIYETESSLWSKFIQGWLSTMPGYLIISTISSFILLAPYNINDIVALDWAAIAATLFFASMVIAWICYIDDWYKQYELCKLMNPVYRPYSPLGRLLYIIGRYYNG